MRPRHCMNEASVPASISCLCDASVRLGKLADHRVDHGNDAGHDIGGPVPRHETASSHCGGNDMPNPLTSPEGTMVLPIESELFPEVEPTAQPRIVASPAANSFHSDPTQAVPVAAPQQSAAGWFARRRAAAATAPPSADGADVSSAPAAKRLLSTGLWSPNTTQIQPSPGIPSRRASPRLKRTKP